MSDSQHQDPTAWVGARVRRADRECDRFEAAWKAGLQRRIEDHLAAVPEPERPALLRELILLEVDYRRLAGEPPRAEEFLARFPGLDSNWLVAVLSEAATPATHLAPVPATPPASDPEDALVGRRIGPYLIQQRVGSGGMGSVYRALREDDYHQQVALKVIRPGLDGDEILRRFRTERQVLAELEHPHIPRLLDGGATDDGRPYFVMEYIVGEPLDRYCDRQQLSTNERLRLLQAVCGAVQHAHERGLVHRDLKPGNVLTTADGTPKVTDFGLVKRLEGGPGEATQPDPTPSGALLGTPSYMAPEQAGGKPGEVGTAADVYALGAILYELLTGRPPFRAETPLDTLLQVLQEEPVPPSNLHPKLSRDLETICLKCLQKEPRRRYASAGALADDLGRFLQGEPIQARPVRAWERALKWMRRRPALAALVAALLLLVVGGGGGGLWWAWQRAEQARAVHGELEQVADALAAGKLAEARTALGRAEGRVAGGAPADLRRRVRQWRDDVDLVDSLERIRLQKATLVSGMFDYASADRDYAALFGGREVAVEGEDPGAVVARIQGSAARAQLVAALDDWAIVTEQSARRVWLLEVVRRADPGAWSDRFRDPAVWEKQADLEQLAREANLAELTPHLLTVLSEALRRCGADPVPLLHAAQQRHPADFWLNFLLGNALAQAKPEEAIGYYRAALALRPDTSAVHLNLGNALSARGQGDEAIAAYRKAIHHDPRLALAHLGLGNALSARGQREEAITAYQQAIALDPRLAQARYNLGNALSASGQLDKAIAAYRKAIALDPRMTLAHVGLGNALSARGQRDEAIAAYCKAIAVDPKLALAHYNFGNALRAKGQLDKAIAAYRRAIALDRKLALAHIGLGIALYDKRQLDEAIVAYRKAIAVDPKLALAHYNLGNALAAKGQRDEAIAAYRKAIAVDPKLALAHYNLGIGLYHKGQLVEAIAAYRKAIALDRKDARAHYNLAIALAAKGQLDETIAAYRKAIDLDPKDARAHYNLGLALQTKGQVDEAIQAYRKAIHLDPKDAKAHGVLGQALLKQGRFVKARAATRRFMELLPPNHPLCKFGTHQLRECERLLALNDRLPAILQGNAKPADAAEQVALAQLCRQHKQLYAASARFYVQTFVDQPPLAQDLRAGHRYSAARAAALAAAGQGIDASTLADKERASLRRLALNWLRADLTAWTNVLDMGPPQARPLVQQALQHWHKDPDLAGLRDKAALAKLSKAERIAWDQFWADVAVLLKRAQPKPGKP